MVHLTLIGNEKVLFTGYGAKEYEQAETAQ